MKLQFKNRRIHTFKITIKPLEWHFIPNQVGGDTPNVREIFFLCFRINIYLVEKLSKQEKMDKELHYKKLYGVN